MTDREKVHRRFVERLVGHNNMTRHETGRTTKNDGKRDATLSDDGPPRVTLARAMSVVPMSATIAPRAATRVSSRASMRAPHPASGVRLLRRRRRRPVRTFRASSGEDEDASSFVEFKESSAPGGSEPTDDKKPLPGSGVNLYDPAATASRWLTRRFGIVGGLGFVALLASVEGGEILRAVLEDLREGEGTNEEFSLGPPELGLVASDSRVGGGATPKRGDFTGVNVVIADADTGDVYVDTKKTKRPIAFTFERRPLIAPVCPALEEGVRTMRRGGVRKVLAPAAAGFGERGVVLSDGTRVPPNAKLALTITLEEVSSSYL